MHEHELKKKPEKSWDGLEMVVEYTDEIVCPWCGYEHYDSWEHVNPEGKIECDDCEKIFEYSRAIDITYSTFRNLTEEEKKEGESRV